MHVCTLSFLFSLNMSNKRNLFNKTFQEFCLKKYLYVISGPENVSLLVWLVFCRAEISLFVHFLNVQESQVFQVSSSRKMIKFFIFRLQHRGEKRLFLCKKLKLKVLQQRRLKLELLLVSEDTLMWSQ